MVTKILLTCAAFVGLLATSQALSRVRSVYMRPMGWVQTKTRNTAAALFLYALAPLLAAIAWVAYP